jgi:RNA recognition motif-containing protein
LHRQYNILALSNTFSNFSNFLAQWDEAQYEANYARGNTCYQKSLELSMEYQRFEDLLKNTTGSQLETHALEYLQYVKENALSSRISSSAVKSLFERLVTEVCPVNEAIWDEYLFWSKEQEMTLESVAHLQTRACNACPSSQSICGHQLRSVCCSSPTQSNLDSLTAYASKTRLLLGYDARSYEQLALEEGKCILRCAPSTSFLSWYEKFKKERGQHVESIGNCTFELEKWIFPILGEVETNVTHLFELANDLKDQCSFSSVWEVIMSTLVLKTMYKRKDKEMLGKMRCLLEHLCTCTDNPLAIYKVWLEFEYLHGTQHQIERLLRECKAYETYYANFYANAAVVTDSETTNFAEEKIKYDIAKKRKRHDERNSIDPKKTKAKLIDPKKNLEKLNKTIVVKHVEEHHKEALRDLFSAFGSIKDIRILSIATKSDRAGSDVVGQDLSQDSEAKETQVFILFQDQKSVVEAFRLRKALRLAGKEKPLEFQMVKGSDFDPLGILQAEKETKIAQIQKEKEEKHATYHQGDQEQTTLYVANLSKSVTEDQLKAGFGADGRAVRDVRLMVTKDGESKGYAYVEMMTPDDAAEIIAQFHQKPLGSIFENISSEEGIRLLSVAFSDPTRSKNAKKATQNENVDVEGAITGTRVRDFDPRTLFIANLPFSTTEEALRSMLEPHGNLISIRMLKDEKKRFRGIAFATFDEESCANNAIKDLHQTKVQEREISVQIASPTRMGGNSGEIQKKRLVKDSMERHVKSQERQVKALQSSHHQRQVDLDQKELDRVAKKLFLDNIPMGINETTLTNELQKLLSSNSDNSADQMQVEHHSHGIEHVHIAATHDLSPASTRRHAIVTFNTPNAAAEAMLRLTGTSIAGELIQVSFKRPMAEKITTSLARAPLNLAPRLKTQKKRLKVVSTPRAGKPQTEDISIIESNPEGASRDNQYFRDAFYAKK